MFVGRTRELDWLDQQLATVRATGQGRFVSIRGRRQVGKSTLVEEFLQRADVPGLFFAASQGVSADVELAEFVRIAGESGPEFDAAYTAAEPRDWGGALRLLATTITRPSVLVIDEFPWLAAGRPEIEGLLQTAWDRHLSRVPVLLVLLGSDLSMMEQLGAYGRPLYQRMRELVLQPLTVAETADWLQLDPAGAVDAQLVTGGFPRLLQDWPSGAPAMDVVREQLADSTSPLVVVGERILAAEFPPATQAREVLTAVGGGETTFGQLGRTTGINQGSLSRTLATLSRDLRVLSADRPLSSAPSRLTRYAVADPYLRLWLRFLGPGQELILRGRGDVVADRIATSWTEYRGRAVEPLVRHGIERLLPHDLLGDTRHVGAWWTRTHDVEVDLIGSPEPSAPAPVTFVGSVKWRERAPFDRDDARHLAAQRAAVPGAAGVPLVGVARTGVTGDVDLALTAADIVDAWR